MNKKEIEALIECLKFLDDLNVQLLDHTHSDEEVERSVSRWGLLVPSQLVAIRADVLKSTVQRKMKAQRNLARIMRKGQSDRVNMARTVLQELIREFGKSDDVPLDEIEPG